MLFEADANWRTSLMAYLTACKADFDPSVATSIFMA